MGRIQIRRLMRTFFWGSILILLFQNCTGGFTAQSSFSPSQTTFTPFSQSTRRNQTSTDLQSGIQKTSDSDQETTEEISLCLEQEETTVSNGQCHFGRSCLSQEEAALEIQKQISNYASCSLAVPVVVPECLEAYGETQAYQAACPLLSPQDSVALDD